MINFLKNKEIIHSIQIGYVWDKEDKYLVIIDNKNKIKYIPNTYKSIFDKVDVLNLCFKYMDNILKDKMFLVNATRKVSKICHNDDFYCHYKKNYKIFYPKKCEQIGLSY